MIIACCYQNKILLLFPNFNVTICGFLVPGRVAPSTYGGLGWQPDLKYCQENKCFGYLKLVHHEQSSPPGSTGNGQ
jgi:hypothetical protein